MLLLLLACAADEDLDGDGVVDGDCDPTSAAVYPGAHEFCDGVDNDCDDLVDETFDLDGDGYLADEADCRALGVEVDCDDADAAVHPGAEETCDGRDEDCSGVADDAEDADGDGVGACDDCDDDDPFVSPEQPEACDGIDNDCSGAADEPWDDDADGLSECADDCDDDDPSRAPGLVEACDGVDNDCDGEIDEGFDADGDGWLVCRGDCDDTSALVYPGAVEACDGVDNDCDFTTSEDQDLDDDGYTLCDGDCDDASAAALPGGTEACDGVDNDCNGATDELQSCWGCSQAGDYLLCTSSVTWDQAEGACEAFGRTLVVIDDATENTTVSSLYGSYLWLGYTDADTEGSWAWVDGSAGGFTQWYSGEPNNSGNEDCAATNFGAWTYWNDFGCTSTLPFVCE